MAYASATGTAAAGATALPGAAATAPTAAPTAAMASALAGGLCFRPCRICVARSCARCAIARDHWLPSWCSICASSKYALPTCNEHKYPASHEESAGQPNSAYNECSYCHHHDTRAVITKSYMPAAMSLAALPQCIWNASQPLWMSVCHAHLWVHVAQSSLQRQDVLPVHVDLMAVLSTRRCTPSSTSTSTSAASCSTSSTAGRAH